MPRSDEPKEGLVDALTDTLALRILRGELAPGARLPSVRELARANGVNVSTVQRVLAKLEENGLVVAHARSGVEVLDPARHAGTRVFPLLLRHASAHRERAVSVLRDALATRRVLASHVARDLAKLPHERYGDALDKAIEGFSAACEAVPRDLHRIAEAENEILRTVLIAAERPTVLAIANDVSAILASSEVVLDAFYRDAAVHVASWRTFARMLATRDASETFAMVEPMLEAIDVGLVRAFAKSLGLDAEGAKAAEHEPRRRKARSASQQRRTKR